MKRKLSASDFVLLEENDDTTITPPSYTNKPVLSPLNYTLMQTQHATQIVDNIALTVFFSSLLNTLVHAFLEEIGRFFLFPFIATASLFNGIFSVARAARQKSTSAIIDAMIDMGTGLAIGIATAGILLGVAKFAVIAPAIFTAGFAIKAVRNIIPAIGYAVSAALVYSPERSMEYKSAAIKHGVTAGVCLAAGASVSCVMLLGIPVMAVAGVLCGIALIGLGLHKAIKTAKDNKILPNHVNTPVGRDQRFIHQALPTLTPQAKKKPAQEEAIALLPRHNNEKSYSNKNFYRQFGKAAENRKQQAKRQAPLPDNCHPSLRSG